MAKARIRRLNDPEAVGEAAADEFARCAEKAIAERGLFRVVLSGGSTLRRMLEILARSPHRESIAWSGVHFLWGDEGAVPPDHPDSNYRMACESLLDELGLPSVQVHRLAGESDDLDDAAHAYQRAIAQACDTDPEGDPPALDLVFLGIGEDGHTASLFPHTSALSPSRRWVVSNFVPRLDAPRLTLTLRILNAARHVVFLATGEEKAEVLSAIVEGPFVPDEYPAQLVDPEQGELCWLVDRAAARGLAGCEAEDDHSAGSMRSILAGDIGGTKTVLGLYEETDAGLTLRCEGVFASADYTSLETIIERFLRDSATSDGGAVQVDSACLGVAGAVIDGTADLTNLSWRVSEEKLSSHHQIPHVKLQNDLEACAYGMLELEAHELDVLQAGEHAGRRGNIAVIAAGTGLGQAMLIWDGEKHVAIATEGGHGGFAPRDDEEIGLLQFLQREFGSHVSYERVLSGPGLYNLYRYLREVSGVVEPVWLYERLQNEDPSGVISEVGNDGLDPVCTRAAQRFASIYGSEAGNMALRCMALGGVMIGGGIAPKMLPVLKNGSFLESFTNKGRFSEVLRGIEVSVALDPRTPLRGAAEVARRL